MAFVLSGMYGPVSALGAGNAILIVCQLFLMGVLAILMDQLLQKGCVCGEGRIHCIKNFVPYSFFFSSYPMTAPPREDVEL